MFSRIRNRNLDPQEQKIRWLANGKVTKKGRPFYGWTVVGVSFVTLAVSFGIWYSFSVFMVALINEFGWSRAATAGVFSVFMIVHSVAAIAIGSLLDRFGPRRIIPCFSILVVVGLIGSSSIESIWQFYTYYGVITAIGICSIGFIAHSIIVPKWFSKKRGLAMGIATSGIGFGMLILVPIIQQVILHWGWRTGYCVHAASVLLLIIPANAVFQRTGPEEVGELPDGQIVGVSLEKFREENLLQSSEKATSAFQWTLRNSLRTSRFWWLFFSFFLTPMAIQGVFIHQVAHVVDKGFSAQEGAFFFGLTGIFGSLGKVLFGHLSDTIGRKEAFSLGMGCVFLGVLSLMMLQRERGGLLYGYAVFFGLGYGSIAPIYPSHAADLFQGPRFGKIFGFLAIAGGLGGATGAWMNGKLFDMTESYRISFVIALFILVLASITFWFTSSSLLRSEGSEKEKGHF